MKIWITLIITTMFVMSGCSYVTPGGPANMKVFTQAEIKDAQTLEIIQRQPVSPLPVSMVAVRVQAPGYQSYTTRGCGSGKYSVITSRDIEEESDFARIKQLQEIANIAPLNRLLIEKNLTSDLQLRRAAAALNADMILLYTIETDFFVGDDADVVTALTLGLSWHRQAKVATTASALLMDARTGYVYGTAEATEKQTQPANLWTSADAVDQSRRKTERAAFVKLIDEFEKFWPWVIAQQKQRLAAKENRSPGQYHLTSPAQPHPEK